MLYPAILSLLLLGVLHPFTLLTTAPKAKDLILK